MEARQQSVSTYVVEFLMVDSTDGKTPKTGLTPAVTVSKNGGAFASVSGTIGEVGNGVYQISGAGLATDLNTLGKAVFYATATGADPAHLPVLVVAFDPFDAAGLGLSRIDASVNSRSSHSAADVWAVGTRTLTSFGTLVADVWSYATRVLTAGTNIVLAKGTGLTGLNDLSAPEVNAQVDQALIDYDPATRTEATADKDEIVTAIGNLTAPDNATISTINTKLGTPVASVSEDIAGVKAETATLLTRITSGVATMFGKLINMINGSNQFTADALSLAPTGSGGAAVNVILPPVTATIAERAEDSHIVWYTKETIANTIPIVDGNGAAVDLSSYTLQLVFEKRDRTDLAVIENANITVSGSGNNQIGFDVPAAVTNNEGDCRWALRETSANTRIAGGTFEVRYAPSEDA